MYKILDNSEGCNIGVQLSGEVSKVEREEVVKKFKDIVDANGMINILIELSEFEAFGSEALAVDMEYVMPVVSKLKRFAFVSDSKWQEWYIDIDKTFAKLFGIEESYFDVDKIDDAWKWLKE